MMTLNPKLKDIYKCKHCEEDGLVVQSQWYVRSGRNKIPSVVFQMKCSNCGRKSRKIYPKEVFSK